MNNENEIVQVELLETLAEAIAINKKAHKLIDKVYIENQENCMRLIKDNPQWQNLKSLDDGSIKKQEYFLKALSIVSQPDLGNEIVMIVKNAYKEAYNYAQSVDTLKLSRLLFNLSKKLDFEKTSDEILNGYMVSALIVAEFFDKKVDQEDKVFISFINSILMLNLKVDDEYVSLYKNSEKGEKNLIDAIEHNVRTMYLKNGYIPYPLKLKSEKYNGPYLTLSKLSNLDRKVVPFEYIEELEGLSITSIVSENILSRDEVKDLIICYLRTNPVESSSDINYADLVAYLVPAINTKYLLKEYKKAKQMYFDIFNKGIEEQLKLKEVENRELKKKNLLAQDTLEKLKVENEALINKNNVLSKEINDLEVAKMERVALIERLYSLEQEVECSELDNAIATAINESAVVFGGHPKWINRMKALLPNWTFIPSNSLNFDSNIVKNNKYIFIYTKYNGHDMYNKVISCLTKDNVLKFINSTNFDRVVSEIENL